ATGPTQRSVLAIVPSHTAKFYVISTDDDSDMPVLATGAHPFWTARGWVPAKELKPGDVLFDNNRAAVFVRSTSIRDMPSVTYNLTVQQAHTFFVRAGHRAVLVHNIDPWNIAFTRPIPSPGETFSNGPWAGRTVAEAIALAREQGALPEGL